MDRLPPTADSLYHLILFTTPAQRIQFEIVSMLHIIIKFMEIFNILLFDMDFRKEF